MLLFLLLVLVHQTNSIFYDLSNGNQSLADSILKAIDFSVQPCDNLYNFSCGRWLKSSNETYESRFYDLFKLVNKRMAEITHNGEIGVLTDMVEMCRNVNMDQEKEFYQRKYFHDIEMLSEPINPQEVVDYLGKLYKDTTMFAIPPNSDGYGRTMLVFSAFFNLQMDIDNNTGILIPNLTPSLNLDYEKYYPSENSSSEVIRYKKLLSDFFIDEPSMVEEIWDFEENLHDYQPPSFDVGTFFVTLEELNAITRMDFSTFFKNLGMSNLPNKIEIQDFSDGSFTYYGALYDFLYSQQSHVLKSYLKYNTMKMFYDMKFPDPPNYCSSIAIIFEPLIAKTYVQKFFKDAAFSQKRITNLVDHIKKAFDGVLERNTWMSDKVKKYAQYKLSEMQRYILSSEEIEPFEKLFNKSQCFSENIMRMSSFLPSTFIYPNFGKKIPFSPYWIIDELMVNAFNMFLTNSIVIPAGILQNPFYDDVFPTSVYYSRIGSILGHEISHSFDNKGRNFDAHGNFKDWWDQSSEEEYIKRTGCFINQYNKFYPRQSPGKHIDGKLTLPENIADNVGLENSFMAFTAAIGPGAGSLPSTILPQFTNNQLFFITYSQLWCEKTKYVDLTDVHSPSEFRPIGTGQNSVHFAEAFLCPSGTYMNPVEKCVLF